MNEFAYKAFILIRKIIKKKREKEKEKAKKKINLLKIMLLSARPACLFITVRNIYIYKYINLIERERHCFIFMSLNNFPVR